ncbi:MAG TPA: glycosyltransferase [Salinivirgaceae bacterium]|nr:glycosyltransferase [Salinivirgaceae bacterium]
MKRIILCVTNDLENDQRVNRSASTLYENGYNVTVVGRKLKRSSKFTRLYKTHRFKLLFSKKIWFYAEYNIRLFFYLCFRKVDILLANDLDTLLACWAVSKIKRCYLVYDSHELFTEVPELMNRTRVKNAWLALERFLVPKIDVGITVCQPIADIYKKKYGKQFEVIRNVPIPKESKSITNKTEQIIIYQGAINKDRGIELLIEAMLYLQDYTLYIVGYGDLFNNIKQKVEDKKIKNVTLTGHIPYDNLQEITSKAIVGVSLEEDSGLNYRFALPNKIFDYIQAEIPVVVSNLPVMAELVKTYDIGEILYERDPKALAQTLRNTVEKYKSGYYTANISNAAKLLNWNVEKRKFLSIFVTLIK